MRSQQPTLTPAAAAIAEALARLAIARSTVLDEVTLAVYADALEDVDPALVARACAALSRERRGEFETALPDVGTIRERCESLAAEDIEAARRRMLPALPVSDDDGPRYFCLSCRDESSGFRPFWCPGSGEHRTLDRPARSEGSIVDCGRSHPHGSHDYVARCECWQRNPVVEARRQRQHVKREASTRGRRTE